MKAKIYFFIILSLLAVIGCSAGGSKADFYVSKVIDGDTIELSNGKTVRYIGIDTPELRERKGSIWVYKPEEYGLQAEEANKKLVEGKKVTLEFDIVKTDKYGRWLAYVFVDNKMVNQELLRLGYAVLYTYPPNVKYVEKLVAAQQEARQKKRGFWKSYEIITHQEAAGHIGEFYTVRGRVTSTFASKKVVFLNFGRDWHEDFTVAIFKSNLGLFEDKAIDPVVFYKNKQIEVTGKIKFYNGPEIIINHPSQIKVIN
ncbi:MAG: thermonuclease family protein [Candidatus Omnitrophota bacterium]|nr:thermonuclease family protein [Candidatus Omnitrophota bacterium]